LEVLDFRDLYSADDTVDILSATSSRRSGRWQAEEIWRARKR
jgi:hypothetical protein